MAGSDDFLVHVTAQDIDHLHAFLLDQFTNRREIVSFRTSIIYQHLTNPVLDPLPPGDRAPVTPRGHRTGPCSGARLRPNTSHVTERPKVRR
ncbi:Lrp/AsnC ligand binding domain-containing protein [Streptomyces mordarskii]